MNPSEPGWYAPPADPNPYGQSFVPGGDMPLEPGSFGIRAVAHIVDIVLTMFVAFFAGAVGGILVALLAAGGMVAEGWQQRIGHAGPATYLFGIIASLAYHTLGEGLGGATAGKAICGLRVLGERRESCSMGKSLIRNLAYYIDALFFGLVGWTSMSKSPMLQRYGDKWAGTIVVRTRSAQGMQLRSPALGIVIGFFAYGVVQVVALLIKAV